MANQALSGFVEQFLHPLFEQSGQAGGRLSLVARRRRWGKRGKSGVRGRVWSGRR